MSELKPCPFCGEKPRWTCGQFKHGDTAPQFDGLAWWKLECHDSGHHAQTDRRKSKASALEVWNRRIAALPQQITAETVRRVLDAMGGLIGSGTKPDDWLNHEAIAHRANQQEK